MASPPENKHAHTHTNMAANTINRTRTLPSVGRIFHKGNTEARRAAVSSILKCSGCSRSLRSSNYDGPRSSDEWKGGSGHTYCRKVGQKMDRRESSINRVTRTIRPRKERPGFSAPQRPDAAAVFASPRSRKSAPTQGRLLGLRVGHKLSTADKGVCPPPAWADKKEVLPYVGSHHCAKR